MTRELISLSLDKCLISWVKIGHAVYKWDTSQRETVCMTKEDMFYHKTLFLFVCLSLSVR